MPRGGRRVNAGRKVGTTKADGLPTKVVRVSSELPNENYQNLPSLMAVIDYWEDELSAARARGESVRTYEKLEKLLDEVRALGF